MNITIDTSAATDDARQVDSIVASMEEDMKALDYAIKNAIADGEGDPGILTQWSSTVKNNWLQYCSTDIPAAFADMKLSATNLRLAVEEALKYSNEG